MPVKLSTQKFASSKAKKPNQTLIIAALVILAVILAAPVVILSGSFRSLLSPTAPDSEVAAAKNNPVTNTTFKDDFADGRIDTNNWSIIKIGSQSDEDIRITEKANEKLQMRVKMVTVEEGLRGILRFKPLMAANSDFSVKVELPRLESNEQGYGRAGVELVAADGQTRIVRVLRRRSPSEDVLVFRVKSPSGQDLDYQTTVPNANKVTLKLDRVNGKYRAFYKPGVDTEGVPWTKIGGYKDDGETSRADAGYLQLYAANSSPQGGTQNGRVVARFDDVKIQYNVPAPSSTPAPTITSRPTPTVAPTNRPTSRPTNRPTTVPTAKPTGDPKPTGIIVPKPTVSPNRQ